MIAYHSALLLHLLLLTYWLGADLGVFYSSRYVLRPDLGAQARAIALKIMMWLDQAPRIALVLFLPSGVWLMSTDKYGEDVFAGWPVALAWVGGLAWLGLVLADHVLSPSPLHTLVKRVDLLVRFALVAGLAGAAIYALVDETPFGVDTNPKWLAVKVLLYATAMASGIAIRYRLRPFGPAFGELMTTGSSPGVETALRRSVNGSIPYVAVIWACVLGAAILGVYKPGADL